MRKHMMIVAAIAAVVGGFTATEAVAGPEGKCKACHTFDQGGKNKTGPNLFGIMGKKAGSVEGFKYGSYLTGSEMVWNDENMRAWLEDSKEMAKTAGGDTKMPPQKMKGAKADKIIEFLNGLK